MGRRYEENLTKQQRVEDGTGLREVMCKTHGPIEPDHWRKVLVGHIFPLLFPALL